MCSILIVIVITDMDNYLILIYCFFPQVVECQFLECIKILLEHGAQANVVDVNNSTSLHLAAVNGDIDAAVLLLEREAKVDAKDKVHLIIVIF